jgi:hypothetical protein
MARNSGGLEFDTHIELGWVRVKVRVRVRVRVS